ncbi:MAG: VWA domain-containing protein, partial [Phycisphaerae bacterium]
MSSAPNISAAWVQFGQPWWLAALVLVAGPVLIAAYSARRGRHVPTWSVALQMLAIAALVLAVSGPTARLGAGADKAVLVLRDVSASTRDQRQALPLPEQVPVQEYLFARGVSRGEPPADDATELSSALRLATAKDGQLSGVVLVSDGQFTDDWQAAAEALSRTDVPVWITPLQTPPADARIAWLDARRRRDGKIRLRVTLRSNAPLRRTLVLRRQDADEPLLRRTLTILPDQPASLHVLDTPPPDQVAVYQAAIDEANTFPENNTAQASVLPQQKQVAIIDGPILARMIPEGSGRFVSLDPADVPADSRTLSAYSAVLLADASGMLLSEAQRAAVADYVRAGGGLVLVGAGPYASAADRADPLNQVAALVPNPQEREPMKVILAVDASGSMGRQAGPAGQSKFELAAEAVLSLRKHLTDSDSLAVVSFSDKARTLYDSGSAAPNFAAVRESLRTISPTGPTDVEPALREAIALAPAEKTGLVILLSDLLTRSFEPAGYVEAFNRKDLSLAVVLTGSGSGDSARTKPLEQLAGSLDAPVVSPTDLKGLADVFGRFVRSTRGDAIRRGRFELSGIRNLPGDVSALPAVDSYVLSAAADGATVLAGIAGDPVAARRRVGLGRSITLAIPISAGENAAWRASPAVGRMLAGAIGRVARPSDDPRFSADLRRTGDDLELTVTAEEEGQPMNDLSLTGSAWDADAAVVARVGLRQTAPGE